MTDAGGIVVRRATAADAAIIARQRAEMFRDMGVLRDEVYDRLVDAATLYVARAIAEGEYLAWLAAPANDPATVIGGAGVQLRPMLPRPHHDTGELALGPQALVMNVYTERAWRRHGVAALLMRHVVTWAGATGITSLVLHASDDGRPLYEQIGFVPTNEMRYVAARDPGAGQR